MKNTKHLGQSLSLGLLLALVSAGVVGMIAALP
jgi:hypothetical protein